MRKQAKFFLDVDGEGMLKDSLGIVADVNFDCYESIVSSCKRIIAAYKETIPQNVDVLKLFYYKKRARSARLNPVRVYTTTDVFRAVAEHPTGDIPLGVVWNIEKNTTCDNVKVKIERNLALEEFAGRAEDNENSAVSSKRKVTDDTQNSNAIDKKRKMENIYKTYMPLSSNVISKVTNVSTSSVTGGQKLVAGQLPGQTIIAGQLPGQTLVAGQLPGQTAVAGQLPGQALIAGQFPLSNRTSASPDPTRKGGSEQEDHQAYKARVQRETRMKYTVTNNYQWPDDVQCEFVMRYGGITERQLLPISVTNSALDLIKEHSSASIKRSDVLEASAQGKLKDMYVAVKERISEQKKPKIPITNIQDAKMEIFKVFSSLNLSKARFDSLLDWLKNLKLEEGKQGKFFLTERSKIGSGLKVFYDTDELAANKLNQLYRSRAKENIGKSLHPLLSAPKPQENPQPPLMFVVPNAQPTATPASVAPQFMATSNIKLLPQPMIPLVTTTTKASTTNSATLSKNSDDSKSNQTPEELPKTNTSRTKRTEPTILRKKHLKQKKRVSKGEDPVPMHLYRAYNLDEDSDNTRLISSNGPSFREIKTEPVSCSDAETESAGDEDSDCNNSEILGMDKEKYRNLLNALKSDAQLPQSEDQTEKQFEYVTVKTEPLDDY